MVGADYQTAITRAANMTYAQLTGRCRILNGMFHVKHPTSCCQDAFNGVHCRMMSKLPQPCPSRGMTGEQLMDRAGKARGTRPAEPPPPPPPCLSNRLGGKLPTILPVEPLPPMPPMPSVARTESQGAHEIDAQCAEIVAALDRCTEAVNRLAATMVRADGAQS